MPPANPGQDATLQRWWEQHSELDQLVLELESTLEGGEEGPAAAASAEMIEGLRAHLTVEEDVYLPLVERLLPDQAPEIERIRHGHAELLKGLDRIQAEIARSDLEAALAAFRRLMGHFREHEKAESRIVERLRSGS